jgi:NADH-quinone oxidoreductase subunit J
VTEILGFWVAAVVLVAASLAVVLTPNLFHAVLWLAAALVATGGVFLLLDSPFLFAVQLLLYAGGVVTIVVFAIMLTERLVGESIRQTSRFVFNGAVLAAALFVGIVGFLLHGSAAPPPVAGDQLSAAVFVGIASFLLQAPAVARPLTTGDQLRDLGRALVGSFAAPLQLLGVLLVIALLGALYFARAED